MGLTNRFRIVGLVLLLGLSTSPGWAQSDNQVTAETILVACVNAKVSPWRVNANGNYSRIPIEFDTNNSGSLGRWQMCPLVSPDGRLIAFGKDGDIWIYEIDSGKQRQLTFISIPPTSTHTYVFAGQHLWSQDSRRLLYYVEHGLLEDVEGYRPDLLAPEAPYGFGIIDVATGESKKLNIDEDIHAWLPNGRLLYAPSAQPPTNGQLWTYDPETEEKSQITTNPCWYNQITVSSDGNKLVTLCHSRSVTQIQELNILTKEDVMVIEEGLWADYQWPTYSPSGQIAYSARTVKVPIPHEQLQIDGRIIAECIGYGRNRWIDEQTILWTCENQASVIDTLTGEAKTTFEYFIK